MTQTGDSKHRQYELELDRIQTVYTARDHDRQFDSLYAPFRPSTLFTVQEREWATVQLLREAGLDTLEGLDILDVGCGSGTELLRFLVYGAQQDRLAGIDLMPDRVAVARRVLPAADIRLGSGHELPFPDATYDLVTQFTVFSSIHDAGLRQAIADEMWRVVRPRGHVLWYDIRRLPRANAALVAIDEAELARLFPGGLVRASRVTLQWGATHRVVHRSRLAGLLLERLPTMTSHLVAVIHAPGPVSSTD